jgi:hypothetical protein
VFNPLAPHELTLGVGRVLRMAADADPDSLNSGYGRSQLLSGYSVARHLAAEEAAATELLAWLRAELDATLQGDEPHVTAARDAVRAATSGPQVGAALVPLLAALGDDSRRARIHRVLAEMADREVAALAATAS